MRWRLMGVVTASATVLALGAPAVATAENAAARRPGAAAAAAGTASARTLAVSGGLVLTAAGAGRAGAAVRVARPRGRRTQHWRVVRTRAGAAQKITLRPAYNSRLCLTRSGAEAAGARLALARCRNLTSQQFIGLTDVQPQGQPRGTWPVFITSWDARYCVTVAGGAVSGHRVVLGACRSALRWSTTLNLGSTMSAHYQELAFVYNGPELTMGVAGAARSGAALSLKGARPAAGQIWTDLAPGKSKAGSMTHLRSLAKLNLCLTVPNGTFKTGAKVRLEKCDPKRYQNVVIGQSNFNTIGFLGNGGYCLGVAPGPQPPTFAAGMPVTLQPSGYSEWTAYAGLFTWGQP